MLIVPENTGRDECIMVWANISSNVIILIVSYVLTKVQAYVRNLVKQICQTILSMIT